tara:strand:+ start:3217 stop:5499 length:2283 start_codon:yes stop_codon:yes gene_type:complete
MAMGKNIMELLFRVKADDAKKDIKQVGDGLGKVGTKGKIAQKGLGFMSKGLKGIGVAIKAAGIGLFIGLLSQLTGLFQSNQKTTDAFSRIMLKLKPIFDAVGKALEFVVGVIEAMIDVVSNVIGWLFGFGDASNYAANALVEQRNKVKLLNAELALIQLQYQKEAELMRQIRDDEARTIEERIQANYELGKVLAEQLEIERNAAFEGLRLAEMELALNEDNIDLQTALIEAKTKLAEIDERITGQRSEQLTNLNSLEREREAQAKEAAAKREEQLKKEAEMLQSLIDLQNEDIKVTKEKFRTINEQFDNAEKANQEQIDFLKKKKKEELAALELSQKNAKKNIEIKKEELQQFEDNNAELISSNQEKADSFERIAQEELKRMGFNQVDYIKTQEDLITFQDNVNKYITKELGKVEEEFGYTVQEMADSWSPAMILASTQALTWAENIQDKSSQAITNIERLTKTSGEEIIAITDEQIEHTEESLNKNLAITDSFKTNQKAIIDKYDKQILEAQESLIDTTETLQEQANNELFLHFETAQEKELRLVEEKYEKLLGLAQGNFLATVQLKAQEEAELEELRTRADKKELADSLALFKKLQAEKKKQNKLDKLAVENKKKMEIDAAQQTLQMGVALAKKGTAEYKALASAETIMSTYLGASKALGSVPPPFNFVQAGLIIATGMKNLAEIQKTKVDGGGSESMPDTITDGGSGDMGDMGGSVPSLPTFGDAGSDMPPVQAFVVETDISNAQALQSELDLQSTL